MLSTTSQLAATGVATISLIFATQSYAQVRDFGSAGGFDIAGKASSRDEKGICVATFEYEGPGGTKTTLSRTPDNDFQSIVWLTVANYEWSAKEDEKYNLSYHFADGEYMREASGVVEDRIYKGFIAGFPAEEFLAVYAKSGWLHVYMGDQVIDKLSLSGSGAGVALFNRCWTWLVGTERTAQAERDRFADIPRDPFAKSGN